MEKIRLGKTEMMVNRPGFGGIPIQRLSEDDAVAVVKRCLDLGINYLDTAINTSEVPLVATKPPQVKLFGKPEPEQRALKAPGYRAIRLSVSCLQHT